MEKAASTGRVGTALSGRARSLWTVGTLSAALIFSMAPVHAQADGETPAFFSGQALLDICERPNSGQCSMYVAGVIDGFFYLDRNESEPRFCRTQITNIEAARVVTKRLASSPTLRRLAAAAAVRIALNSRLSCSANSAN